ncbi:hypothetical protein QBC35DRAFT_484041 [Podospora australis]|uniref:RNA-binding protein n=1 Tax=Podospora australis TaxID=1536484 RepID=A0AAN6X3D2_9PEZI|nr:hypothetical protein QBC35DRAFT_484041 [Podospora australis]
MSEGWSREPRHQGVGGGRGNGSYRDRDYDRNYDHRSPPPPSSYRADDRDGDYRRSRKDYNAAPLRDLNYDEDENDPTVDYGRSQSHGRGQPRPDGPGRQRRPDTKVVVLTGLPGDATEKDILYGLDYATRDNYFSEDQIKMVRFTSDHNGRRIATVEFYRRSDAEEFIDRYWPDITFPLEHSRGSDSQPVTVGIKGPEDRDEMSSRSAHREEEDWPCPNCSAVNYSYRNACFKCKTPQLDGDIYSGPLLTGESDECPQQTPSQYIVIRSLEGPVTEEVLAKGVMKLFLEKPEPAKQAPTVHKLKSTAPTNSTVGLGATPGSLRRVFLMRDRRTNESWRYGFAEFATVEDARAAIIKFRASAKFTISSKPVEIGFIHTGVFVPATDAATAEYPEFSFTPIYNPSIRLKYWDNRAYPSVHVVSEGPPPETQGPEKAGQDDKSGPRPAKKLKKDKDPAATTKIMMPQMELWAKKSAEIHGVKLKSAAEAASPEAKMLDATAVIAGVDDTELSEAYQPHWADRYVSYANWDAVSCAICDWEPPTDEVIKQRGWPQTRGDLLIEHEGKAHVFYRDTEVKDKAAAALAALGKEPRTIIRRTPRTKSEALPIYTSFADFDRLRCVLCNRKFKQAETIFRHEQQSELHKRMLADPANRARAEQEFKKLGKRQYNCGPDREFRKKWETQVKESRAEYRDRAYERRQAYNQPKNPSTQFSFTKITMPSKRKEPASAPTESKETPAKKSKGAGMLSKMGWTAGAGLGAEGAGRTSAIATEAYAPGVGLGAEGGKLGDAAEEAQRRTKGGSASFVEKTKDRARERYFEGR